MRRKRMRKKMKTTMKLKNSGKRLMSRTRQQEGQSKRKMGVEWEHKDKQWRTKMSED